MPRILFLTILLSLLATPISFAEDIKADQSDKEPKKQEYFIKQICTNDSLEEAINNWISENIDYEIESVSYARINRKDCAIVLYEE